MNHHQHINTFLFAAIATLFLLPVLSQAQLPEQDCSGAIVVTASPDTFPYYPDAGQYQELTYPQNTSCLIGGEENSVWITFGICDTGLLLFEIIPFVFGDDLDWALYDFTNITCADVLDSTNEVRCNYSAIPGHTGVDTPYLLISVNAGGPNQCAALHPYSQQRFLLLINNHANSGNGFILKFGGSATLCLYPVGTQQINDKPYFLYPNPTDGTLQLKNLPSKNNLTIEVMNVYGIKVYGKEVKGSNTQFDLPPTLSNGFYIFKILEEGKVLEEGRVIVSR